MATFEEKWQEFKNNITRLVPDWNTQFLNWADARGFGFSGGFFNEFPHTHTYETDLSWLISRMKWVLFRMDSVEERMKAVEDLLIDFVESLDLPTLIREEVLRQINSLITEEYITGLINTGTIKRYSQAANNILKSYDTNYEIGLQGASITRINNKIQVGTPYTEMGSYSAGSVAVINRPNGTGNITILNEIIGFDLDAIDAIIASDGIRILRGEYNLNFPICFIGVEGKNYPVGCAPYIKMSDGKICFIADNLSGQRANIFTNTRNSTYFRGFSVEMPFEVIPPQP